MGMFMSVQTVMGMFMQSGTAGVNMCMSMPVGMLMDVS